MPIDKHDLSEIYELRVLLEVASIEKIAALRLLKPEGISTPSSKKERWPLREGT